MGFLDEKQLVSPVKFRLDWHGKVSDGFFTNYNKETKENLEYKIGKSAIINIGYSVIGFNDGLNQPLYSNQISKFNEDEIIVKSKGDILARGLWKEIKDKVSAFGGSICKVVTMLDTSNGEITEMYLKGQAGWGIIDKKTKEKLWGGFNDVEDTVKKAMNVADQKFPTIEFDGAKLIKGGAFDYNVPEFKISGTILNEEQIKQYLNSYKEYNEFRKELLANKREEKVQEIEDDVISEGFGDEEINISDIPF